MEAQHRQAWGKGATLQEYDYYLRGHDQIMKYTKEGINRSGEIWREGLARFPESSSAKSETWVALHVSGGQLCQ